MWSIRVLKGPHAGKTFNLREGDNIIGRGPTCTIQLNTAGVSKEHANIRIENSVAMIKDLKSTNGTFVNGVKINQVELKRGDKISLYDCLLDFQAFQSTNVSSPSFTNAGRLPSYQGNAAMNLEAVQMPPNKISSNTQTNAQPAPSNFGGIIKKYFDDVVLPGVYKLGETNEFRWVMGGFVALFIVMVTMLSVIPMIEITKSSIQNESQRRAQLIAQTMAERYFAAVKQGTEATFDTRSIEREDGVKAAYIISSDDGHIIAPLRRSGEKPNDRFIHKARKNDDVTVEQIDGSLIGASIPIKTFSQDAGTYNVTSHAIVLYDMGGLAIDNGRMLSLFVQILTLALFIGFLLYYFMIKFIEYPFNKINSQLNRVLKNETDHVEVKFQFASLQTVLGHINTIIHRSNSSNNKAQPISLFDKTAEAKGIIEIINNPALAMDKNLNVISVNTQFEDLVGLRNSQVEGQGLDSLNDQALILSLRDLASRFHEHSNPPFKNNLEFSGQNYEIELKAIHGEQDISFFLVVMIPSNGGGFNV